VVPDVILHTVNGVAIGQRADDGYFHVTSMCQAAGKLYGDYNRLKTTDKFFAALSRSMGIPIDLLVQIVSAGPNERRGTWVHPQIAIHCAMWCSADFAVQVTSWVERWLTTRQHPLRGPDMSYYRAFLDMSYYRAFLELVREVRTLLQELEMYEDQDRLLLADHVRNVLLAARQQMALTGTSGSTQVALPEPPRVWTVSERILELGYPSHFTKSSRERGHRYLITIGKRLAHKYRQRYPGAELSKSRRYVDGAQRNVATYREHDLDLMDTAIAEVLGSIERAEAPGAEER
jgi:hypothetical protein